jgi:type I restriction enzyme M protein
VKKYKQEVGELFVDIESDLEINKQEIVIGEIFDLSMSKTNNGKLTKTFIDKNQGDIPVYGASKEENNDNYGRVRDNLLGIKYFENCLT